MCKISLWLHQFSLNYSEYIFYRIPNSIESSLVGRAPGKLNKDNKLQCRSDYKTQVNTPYITLMDSSLNFIIWEVFSAPSLSKLYFICRIYLFDIYL